MQSLLSADYPARLVATYDSNQIIKGYMNNFGIDVKSFFKENEISLYECEKSGFRFFQPNDIAGDSSFYEALQIFPWYYNSWKWEHEISLDYIKKSAVLLEIGSGTGGFLYNLRTVRPDVMGYGLELNNQAVSECINLSLNVSAEDLKTHKKKFSSHYDVICSYQVLEHISEPIPFFKDQIDCLKIGGRLIIGVPNNDSFIALAKSDLLNMPPHHIGLWTEKSLKSLCHLLPIELVDIKFEPLQSYHVKWYWNIQKQRTSWLIQTTLTVLRLDVLAVAVIRKFSRFIIGHTVFVVFEKVNE